MRLKARRITIRQAIRLSIIIFSTAISIQSMTNIHSGRSDSWCMDVICISRVSLFHRISAAKCITYRSSCGLSWVRTYTTFGCLHFIPREGIVHNTSNIGFNNGLLHIQYLLNIVSNNITSQSRRHDLFTSLWWDIGWFYQILHDYSTDTAIIIRLRAVVNNNGKLIIWIPQELILYCTYTT